MSAAEILLLPELIEADVPAITKRGLGYRGVWSRQGIVLDFGQIHASHGDLSGLLSVQYGATTPFVAKFNIATLSTRTALAKHLKEISGGYSGWVTILDYFCRHVLRLEFIGPASEMIGGDEEPDEGITYVLDPLIPEGTPAMIYGPPGVMKSTLAVLVSCSVQLGIPILAGWTPRQRNVLVLDWEAGRKEWHNRLVAVANGLGVPPPRIHYRQPSVPLAHLVETIAEQVVEDQIGLVVVDSMMPALGANGEGRDPADTSTRFFQALRAIGTTSLLIGQVTGDGIENGKGTSKAYGSVAQMYETRSVWELRAEADSTYNDARQIVLSHRKVNQGPKQPSVGLRVIHGPTTILFERCDVTAPDLQHTVSISARLERTLAAGPMWVKDICQDLGVAQSTVSETLRRNSSKFVALERGRWALLSRDITA